MKVKDIIAPLEEFAPLALKESYDNPGLLTGHPEMEVTGALLCVDVTADALREAISLNANLVIAHHPVIFHPLRSITGRSNVEEVVIEAIKHDIAIYACHTNLDRARGGMSHALAKILGLAGIVVLDPEERFGLKSGEEEVLADPSVKTDGNLDCAQVGFGAVGELPEPVPPLDFLRRVARRLNTGCIRHSSPLEGNVRRVALITGAGGEGLEKAIEAGADVFLSADLRHDRFLAAEGRILLADIGHFESEFCAIDLIHDIISKKITNFALHKSVNSRNPVNYLV